MKFSHFGKIYNFFNGGKSIIDYSYTINCLRISVKVVKGIVLHLKGIDHRHRRKLELDSGNIGLIDLFNSKATHKPSWNTILPFTIAIQDEYLGLLKGIKWIPAVKDKTSYPIAISDFDLVAIY